MNVFGLPSLCYLPNESNLRTGFPVKFLGKKSICQCQPIPTRFMILTTVNDHILWSLCLDLLWFWISRVTSGSDLTRPQPSHIQSRRPRPRSRRSRRPRPRSRRSRPRSRPRRGRSARCRCDRTRTATSQSSADRDSVGAEWITGLTVQWAEACKYRQFIETGCLQLPALHVRAYFRVQYLKHS